jgi:hypothetical protein
LVSGFETRSKAEIPVARSVNQVVTFQNRHVWCDKNRQNRKRTGAFTLCPEDAAAEEAALQRAF